MPMDLSEKRQFRRTLRQRRRQLDRHRQIQATRGLFRRLKGHPAFLNSHTIAFYRAGDGEIDPFPLLYHARRLGKHCYLPVMRKDGVDKLLFIRYRPGDRLHRSSLYVREPALNLYKARPPWALDLVLVPLVGFDAECNRLGMGKGYYDRTFAMASKRPWSPLLVGVAHECQRVETLSPDEWDVPLDAVVTPERVYTSGRHRFFR